MPSIRRILSRLLLALTCGATILITRAADDVRFSATLTPEQRAHAGLATLSADHLAVIDGLVRQDEAASKFKDNDVDHTRFSERRTARERELAGLDRLSSTQLTQLDHLAGVRITGVETVANANFVASAPSSPSSRGVKPSLPTHQLDIHGEVSFTMGWSKGGSVTGGDILLTYDDPAGRYSVAVGYSEYRAKGNFSPCFFPGYGLYRPYGAGLPSFH